jgi:hypothetical protein
MSYSELDTVTHWGSQPQILPSSRSACSVALPVELWTLIFEYTPRRELCTLCTVSRSFQQLATPNLYRYVNLSLVGLDPWSKQVAQRPDLAAHVRVLSFAIFKVSEFSSARLLAIHKALKCLLNLEELHILSYPIGSCLSPAYVWIIMDCPFRLRVFRNAMFDLQHILGFLASQPDVRVWDQLTATPFEFTDNILPNLTSVSIGSPWMLEKLGDLRPIRKIYFILEQHALDRDEERNRISLLGPYKSTLTIFQIDRVVSEDSLMLEHFLTCLAECVPRLQHLIITDMCVSVCSSCCPHEI